MKSKRVGNEFMLPDNAAKPEKVKQLEEWRGIQDGVTLQMCLLQEGLVPKSFSCPTSPTLEVPGHQEKPTVDQNCQYTRAYMGSL